MSTEFAVAHPHRHRMFSGTVDYRKHSSFTRSSWGARGTQNSCLDTGKAAHQSLNKFCVCVTWGVHCMHEGS